MEIKLKYIRDIEPLPIIEKGDWQDLRSAIDVDLEKGEFSIIPLGVAMELPQNCEAIIAPRSSTYKKYKIIQANSIGIIDNSYCGDNDEWCFAAIALEKTHINKNDRICQFRVLANQDKIDYKVVENLDNKDRGGFGTSGWT